MSNQILHIFRKDVRHHRPEIVLSLIAWVAFAWRETGRINPWNNLSVEYEVLLSLLSALLPIAWVFLIVRVVHGETLVGDRQFWVTRPYEWKKLVAAKLLFILAFVNVPLLLLQIFLLRKAGFPVVPQISGLLQVQALWSVCVILPVITLAAVTASTGQFLLVVLGAVLYLIAAASLLRIVPHANAGVAGADSLAFSLAFLVGIGTSLAVVLWQYMRRITSGPRVLLLCAAVLILIIFAAMPYRYIINHMYPQPIAGQQPSVTLAFDRTRPAWHEGGFRERNNVHVWIPLLVSGIAHGSEVLVAGKMVSIQATGGQRWTSEWYGGSGQYLLPDTQRDQTILAIDKDFFERVKATSVRLHINFALLPRRAREKTRIVAQASGFAVPGNGRCSFSPIDKAAISCVFPLKSPSLLIATKWDEGTCWQQKTGNFTTGITFYGYISPLGAADTFDVSPIRTAPLFWMQGAYACSGTPLTFYSGWNSLQGFREEVEIDGIRLADYQLNDSLEDLDALGFTVP